MGILGVWDFGDFDTPREGRPERVALAAYNLGRHPFLLRIWPEFISWASWPDAAVVGDGDDLDFYTEDEPPPVDRAKVRQQVQRVRYQRQEQLQSEGRSVLPPELAQLQDALRELASAGAIDVVKLVELHQAVDRLRTLFQGILKAYRADDEGELKWLLMREEHPWHDLVDAARSAIQGNVAAQRWCELGFWVGKLLACTSFPTPRDLVPADLQKIESVANALDPEKSTPWSKKLTKFLKTAKPRGPTDWLEQLRRTATALLAVDVAIREELEGATGMKPWLIIDHPNKQFILFGQMLPPKSFSAPGRKLFLVLASRPSEKIDAAELIKEAGLKVAVEYLATYITRNVRNPLKKIVEEYGPAAGVDDPEAIRYAMVLNERKGYMITSDPTGYRLAIPRRLVRHIGTPLLAHEKDQPASDE